MKILKQESPTSRIVQKLFYAPALWGRVICRQRKGSLGWRATSWLYTNQRHTIEGEGGYIEFFDIDESINRALGGRQFFQNNQ